MECTFTNVMNLLAGERARSAKTLEHLLDTGAYENVSAALRVATASGLSPETLTSFNAILEAIKSLVEVTFRLEQIAALNGIPAYGLEEYRAPIQNLPTLDETETAEM